MNIVFRMMGRGPPRIPVDLSTLRLTTSPRLSSVRLEFACVPSAVPSVEIVAEEMINYAEQAADYIARIKREFGEAVNFTVAIDSKIEAVLGRIDVSFCFDKTSWPHKFISAGPCRSSIPIEM